MENLLMVFAIILSVVAIGEPIMRRKERKEAEKERKRIRLTAGGALRSERGFTK